MSLQTMNFNITGLWNKVKRNKNLGGKVKLDEYGKLIFWWYRCTSCPCRIWYKHVQSFPSTHKISWSSSDTSSSPCWLLSLDEAKRRRWGRIFSRLLKASTDLSVIRTCDTHILFKRESQISQKSPPPP